MHTAKHASLETRTITHLGPHDASLKTQVALCEALVETAATDDEKKIAMVWKASMTKFQEFEEGKGDLETIKKELAELAEVPQETPEAWRIGLAKYFSKCLLSGISDLKQLKMKTSI